MELGINASASISASASIGIGLDLSSGAAGAQDDPFSTFNFKVEIRLENDSGTLLCNAAFSECEGLEMTMQVKTIPVGGSNARQVHLVGPVHYSQLTLKRGMTSNTHLWDWFDTVRIPTRYRTRATVEIVMLATGDAAPGLLPSLGGSEKPVNTRILLQRCLPVKLRAPGLNAKEGMLAVEEMQIAYERLDRLPA